MADPLANLKPFQPGNNANPGGKPTGARNRLTKHFLNALADDFEEHGRKAIQECREKKPDAYIKAIAALCPKEIEVKNPLQELKDDELLHAVRALESYLATQPTPERAEPPAERESAH